eukprot:UN29631
MLNGYMADKFNSNICQYITESNSTDEITSEPIFDTSPLDEDLINEILLKDDITVDEDRINQILMEDVITDYYDESKSEIIYNPIVPIKETIRSWKIKKEVHKKYKEKSKDFDKVIFIHVHKAGGTTIRNYLTHFKVEHEVWESYSPIWHSLKGDMSTYLSKGADSRLFLISLRHPVSRFLSQYDFEVRFGCQICDRPEDQLWRISMDEYFLKRVEG